jgi:hypothetical protein
MCPARLAQLHDRYILVHMYSALAPEFPKNHPRERKPLEDLRLASQELVL